MHCSIIDLSNRYKRVCSFTLWPPLPQEKESPIPNGQEAELDPELAWLWLQGENTA
jgi:hypothetical protein